MADVPAKADAEAAKQRAQTEAQIQAIEQDVKANQPLTSELLPVSELEKIYGETGEEGGTTSFLRGAMYLSEKYKNMRKIRGDGNCYYRAVLYSVCESILEGIRKGDSSSKNELERLISWTKTSIDDVEKQGYDRFAVEMFYDELVELFDFIKTSPSSDDVHTKLNEEGGTSEYCTWYLRVVTAAYLKKDSDRFIHFIEGGLDVPTFCSREVEPMGRECEQVTVLALAEAMAIDIAIEYLDGRVFDADTGLTRHEFGPSQSGNGVAGTKITLLYRPGHYDILY